MTASSLFLYLENVLFLKCEEEAVKKEFIAVSECFFKGFCVKFVEWIPNFHIFRRPLDQMSGYSELDRDEFLEPTFIRLSV